MMNWLKKIWRWAFGPTLKSLNSEVVAIVEAIQDKNQSDDKIIEQIRAFQAKADLFASDNPSLTNQITAYYQQLAVRSFHKERFKVVDILGVNHLTGAKGVDWNHITGRAKIAYLMYYEMEFKSKDKERGLYQALSDFCRRVQGGKLIKETILRRSYEGTGMQAWLAFFSAYRIPQNDNIMLTALKKLVIRSLLLIENFALFQSVLSNLLNPEQEISQKCLPILNSWASSSIKGNTRTVDELGQVLNDKNDKNRASKIQALLNKDELDPINDSSAAVTLKRV